MRKKWNINEVEKKQLERVYQVNRKLLESTIKNNQYIIQESTHSR